MMISASFLKCLSCFFSRHMLLIGAGIAVSCAALLLALRLQMAAGFMPDVSGSECSTIFPLQRVATGLPLYTDPQQPPFYVNEYTPLYFSLGGWLYRLLGWDTDNAHRAYLLSRLLSAGLVLLAAGVIYVTLRYHLKFSLPAALLVACTQFCILSYFGLSNSRQDSLLFLWTTLYVLLAARASRRPGTWKWAAMVAVLAFFTKQSGMFHVVTLGFFLLQEKQYRAFFEAAATAALTLGAGLLLLSFSESLPLFFTNVIRGVVHPLSFDWFFFGSMERLIAPFAVLIAGGFVIGFCWIAHSPDRFRRFLGWAVYLFFAATTLSTFKTGSGVGYYQDWSYLALVAVSVSLFEKKQRVLLGWATGIALCGCLYIASSQWVRYQRQPLAYYQADYVLQHQIAAHLREDLQLQPGQHVYVCQMQIPYGGWFLRHLLPANIVVPFDDLITKSTQMDTFDFSGFEQMIAAGDIRFVIGQKGLSPQTVLGQPITAYRLIRNMGDYNIYESERYASKAANQAFQAEPASGSLLPENQLD